MRARYCKPSLCALSAALLMACGRETERSQQPVIRDSAGVQIVDPFPPVLRLAKIPERKTQVGLTILQFDCRTLLEAVGQYFSSFIRQVIRLVDLDNFLFQIVNLRSIGRH